MLCIHTARRTRKHHAVRNNDKNASQNAIPANLHSASPAHSTQCTRTPTQSCHAHSHNNVFNVVT